MKDTKYELTYEQRLIQINKNANHALEHLEIPDQTVTTYLLQIASMSDIYQTRLHESWSFEHRGDFE